MWGPCFSQVKNGFISHHLTNLSFKKVKKEKTLILCISCLKSALYPSILCSDQHQNYTCNNVFKHPWSDSDSLQNFGYEEEITPAWILGFIYFSILLFFSCIWLNPTFRERDKDLAMAMWNKMFCLDNCKAGDTWVSICKGQDCL